MPDPLNPQSAKRTTAIGAIVFASSLATVFLPLIIPLGTGAKYLIAIAFIGAIAGLSIMTNGMIDWWRGK